MQLPQSALQPAASLPASSRAAGTTHTEVTRTQAVLILLSSHVLGCVCYLFVCLCVPSVGVVIQMLDR